MKTAKALFEEFLPLVRTPEAAAQMFAEDGLLELPYLADVGMQTQYKGRAEIAALYAQLLELVPEWRFVDADIVMSDDHQLFAEYKVDAWAVKTDRPYKQHFFGYMRAENGQIKLLREALNIVVTARAFSPNGLADLNPVSSEPASAV